MKHTVRQILFPMIALFAGVAAHATHASQFRTGVSDITISDTQGSRDLKGFVWYPTDETRTKIDHGNKVWQGIPVAKNAKFSDGQYPLVIISHRMMGHSMNQAWLAKGLTEQGYVVAAVNHPGTSFFADDEDDRRELWRRPEDVSRIIDVLVSSPKFAPYIDPNRIFAVGHSLGGMSVFQLVGARYDHQTRRAACQTDPDGLICDILDRWNIGNTPEDVHHLSQDLRDPRIRGIVSLVMGGAQVFEPASLKALAIPSLIYAAPAGQVDMDTNSRRLKALIPAEQITYLEPEGYTHFDFMGLCTEKGLEILKKYEPQDVEVCINGRDVRATKHEKILDEITDFFETLPN